MSRTQRPGSERTPRPGDRAEYVIRAARPDDLPALDDFFTGLSAQTRYLRFFAPVTPGAVMLSLLSGAPGASGRPDAVVAARDGVIIGHAMAVDRPGPLAVLLIRPAQPGAMQGDQVNPNSGHRATSHLVVMLLQRPVSAT